MIRSVLASLVAIFVVACGLLWTAAEILGDVRVHIARLEAAVEEFATTREVTNYRLDQQRILLDGVRDAVARLEAKVETYERGRYQEIGEVR